MEKQKSQDREVSKKKLRSIGSTFSRIVGEVMCSQPRFSQKLTRDTANVKNNDHP